jgi:ribose transport system ATP-binding protein
VDITIHSGEILGLLGENGSGKSTLSSVIAGIQPGDAGRYFLNEKPYNPKNTAEAVKSGICMVLQEKGTFDLLSVDRNVMINKEEQFSKWGIINRKKMIAAAQKSLDEIKASHIPANVPLGTLTFEDRKLVELARAMNSNPQLLIIDETTTALSRTGRQILYQIMDEMKKSQNAVLFISHDIDEVLEHCDRVMVLRDGEYVDTVERKEFSSSLIKSLMVGREVVDNFYRSDTIASGHEEEIFFFENISGRMLNDVSFTLKKGEILGVGGLTDSGIRDVGRLAFGLEQPKKGSIRSEKGKIKTPGEAMRKGVAYISKNRDQEALMLSSSIKENICFASYKKLKTGPLVFPHKENQFVANWVNQLEIKLNNSSQYVMELSGGNKQKVALAKWLGFGADIFILDCPTRGIDVGVKANFYKLMADLKDAGKSIILISEELPEIIGMSDRVMILKEGSISGMFSRSENITESMLIDYIV